MVSPTSIRATPAQPTDLVSTRAYAILRYSHETARGLLNAFAALRSQRKAKGAKKEGASTDEEQDVLRAALVLAGSGLDALLKELLRNSLNAITQSNDAARAEFQTWVSRELKKDPDLLPRLLVSTGTSFSLLAQYVDSLTDHSLQSVEELQKALRALGLDPKAVLSNATNLKRIFGVRNAITHEFDINFDHPNRNRQSRPLETMLADINSLLALSEGIFVATEKHVLTIQKGGV